MMRSLILLKVARGILPVTTLFALYLLLRGHNQPGGGFIAGLVTASAVVLQALAFGTNATRDRLTPLLRPAAALGLLIAAISGVLAMMVGDPFLTHYHWHLPLPGDGYYHLSTTLLFDIGIYMVVVGTAAMLVSSFAEADR
jgi:multisubunit Na+/H+ antiporter MnhB subunit